MIQTVSNFLLSLFKSNKMSTPSKLQLDLAGIVAESCNRFRAHELIVSGRQALHLTNERTGEYKNTFTVPFVHPCQLIPEDDYGVVVVDHSAEGVEYVLSAFVTKSPLRNFREIPLRFSAEYLSMISKTLSKHLNIGQIQIVPEQRGEISFTPQKADFDAFMVFVESTFDRTKFNINLAAGKVIVLVK